MAKEGENTTERDRGFDEKGEINITSEGKNIKNVRWKDKEVRGVEGEGGGEDSWDREVHKVGVDFEQEAGERVGGLVRKQEIPKQTEGEGETGE